MIIQTKKGKIKGIKDKNTIRFSGIAYAKAPVGDLRFKSPVEMDFWEGTYEAFYFKKDPMQYSKKSPFSNFSEDCLYLNIWVPDNNKKDKYPIMVWIPGGAYATGGSGAANPFGPVLYDGDLMAKDMDAIVVTISYRLNVFGFLNLSSFSNCFEDNLGLKDIVMALNWVKDNIEAFNGDKDNITLFGESAGAGCISTLLMMDSAKNLFNRVIMQSNCFGSYYTVEEEEILCKKFLSLLGIENSPVELLDKSYEEIYRACGLLDEFAVKTFFPRCTFCPVVDGEYISNYPTLGNFKGSNIDVLIGSNRFEGNFLRKSMNMTKKESVNIARDAFHRLPEEKTDEMISKYPLPGSQAIADVITDVMYTFPKIRFAEKHSRVYVYRYDYATFMMNLLGYKACHVAEMIPLWNIKVPPFNLLRLFCESTLSKIGKKMRKYWGNFAKTGVPDINWKPYDTKDRYTMVIDKTDHLEKNPEKECMDKYDGLDRIVI